MTSTVFSRGLCRRVVTTLLSTVVAVGLLFAAVGAPDASAAASTKLRFGYIGIGTPPDGAEGYAQTRGQLVKYLKPAGITEVEWVQFQAGSLLQQALVAGAIDAGIASDTVALTALSSGIKQKIINVSRTRLDAWVMGRKGGPSTIAELKGKKVGVTFGSYQHRYLIKLVEAAKLTGQISFANFVGNTGNAALKSGAIDAFVAPNLVAVQLAAQGHPVLDKASKHKGLTGNPVTVVSEKYLNDHKGFPAAWNKARTASVNYLRKNKQRFWAFESQVTSALKLSPVLVERAFPIGNWDPQPFTTDSLNALKGTLKYLVATKLAAKSYDVSKQIAK